ncbi:ABC transporter ATP-binding protein [Eisenbergiella porci]|uniref:ATP-binding cassette domain-containing protein n=1 Tax=Eisenbergiella porci TaxID=2652274 RepID=UPI0023F261DB|nr:MULTISPECIES: ABC transporter ATP-binding protein [Eisenbergiella]MDY5528665.1 ABC transporter ATP-binding protein [Eisenbergiella porci]
MSFRAGGKYAVAGGSGSGKSTLLKLLQGSNDGYRGSILYDGKELRTLRPDSLYDLLSVIQQDVFIFNSSVRDNITMFRDFPSGKVERVIRLAGLEGLINARGADCPCGENGNALSGGERQRISIARSLLRETPVLLVDEATASLDPVTAFGVTDSILSLDGLTRILVTHRLEEAMLRRCDGILVLKNGCLEEFGAFDELMDRKDYFYSLFMVSQS